MKHRKKTPNQSSLSEAKLHFASESKKAKFKKRKDPLFAKAPHVTNPPDQKKIITKKIFEKKGKLSVQKKAKNFAEMEGPPSRENKKAPRGNPKSETTHSRNQAAKKQKWKRKKREHPEVWFDGVDPVLIAASRENQSRTYTLVKPNSFTGPTRRVALDCEFVGVGFRGKDSVLARVSVVNQFGHVLLDKFVRPRERVTDFRTQFSGVRPRDLADAETFEVVHAEVAGLLEGRVLVGHALHGDMKVLFLSHPRHMVRDTARYRPFRALVGGKTPSLRLLTRQVLGLTIQEGEHDSVTDARAAMRLYLSRKVEWEAAVRRRGRS